MHHHFPFIIKLLDHPMYDFIPNLLFFSFLLEEKVNALRRKKNEMKEQAYLNQ